MSNERDADLDDASYDRLINFMESARFKFIQQQFTRETVEHLLIRMGFRMHSPDAVNEIQEQLAFLRRLWGMRPSLEDRVEGLEYKLSHIEKQQLERFDLIMKTLTEKHDENKKRQDDSAAERKEIRKQIEGTKVALLVLALGVIGTLIVRYVLP